MRNNGKNLEAVMQRLQSAQDAYAFQLAISGLKEYMRQDGLLDLEEVERRAYYLRNEYSDKEDKRNMEEAKHRVLAYIDKTIDMDAIVNEGRLSGILENFYLFLENLIERKPHKSGGFQQEQLAALRIKNEYDIQHLLYAYLKPLYPMARTEVSEDTGYGSVRADIFLDAEHVIEVKCTGNNRKLKKLTEEIEADMVHYGAKNIYFFLYDKEKIIENPLAFQKSYEERLEGKKIHIIIHQPKIL